MKGYDLLVANTEKAIAHAEAFIGIYTAIEKDHVLTRLNVDTQDQVHLQNVILSIIKAIKEMEKNLWWEKNYYKLI